MERRRLWKKREKGRASRAQSRFINMAPIGPVDTATTVFGDDGWRCMIGWT